MGGMQILVEHFHHWLCILAIVLPTEDHLDFEFERPSITDNIKSNINLSGNIPEIVKGNIPAEALNTDKAMVAKLQYDLVGKIWAKN